MRCGGNAACEHVHCRSDSPKPLMIRSIAYDVLVQALRPGGQLRQPEGGDRSLSLLLPSHACAGA